MSKDVAILVVADGIGDDIRNRFKNCVKQSKPKVSYDIKMMGEKNPRLKGVPFNKSKLLNQGLKELFQYKYRVIIQCDIDLIVPPNLIDGTVQACRRDSNLCIHCVMRRISPEEFGKYKEYGAYPWAKWAKKEQIYATGCWNGIQPSGWRKTGGFNEYMVEWGAEDTIWMRAAKHRGIRVKDLHRIPLMHVDHPNRTKRNSKHNHKMNQKAKAQDIRNWL